MRYNPEIHHRRSIRLRGYDYSQSGYYFITICTQGQRCLFGEIEKDRMVLNEAGKMIGHWWNELKNKYDNIEIDQYVVMPNHFHGIINIIRDAGEWKKGEQEGEHTGSPVQCGAVGADLCVCPNRKGEEGEYKEGRYADLPQQDSPVQRGRPISAMIQWFKIMTTNEYIRNVKQNHWKPFHDKLWQRNYYENIVREESSLRRIREYIVNNPCQWRQDKLFAM